MIGVKIRLLDMRYFEKIYDQVFLVDVGAPELPQTFSCYVIIGEQVMIIDPGPPRYYKNLLNALDFLGIDRKLVKYIALTHIHIDHAGAASLLIKALPNARILVHPSGVKHLIDPTRLWVSTREVLGDIADFLGVPEPVNKEKIVAVEDYSLFHLNDNQTVLALHTPGHARHHVSFFIKEEHILFAGDSVGLYVYDSSAPTTPPLFKLDLALKSLRKMLRLDPSIIAYTHFGYSRGGCGDIIKYYGQLNLWYDIVKELIIKNCGEDDIFVTLLREDKLASTFLHNIRDNWFLKDAIERSLQGFMQLVLSEEDKFRSSS